jgi:hypothetical protein
MINYCFQNDAVVFKLDSLMHTKTLPSNFKLSTKYLQIKSSLLEVGLVEPVIVFIDSEKNHVKIIDGHLRVEALKDLGESKVKCLISSVYDTFTPNSRVNRITIIQEQRMIKEALNSGIQIEKLSLALNISIDAIRGKIRVLNGISPEVIHAFSNHHVPKTTFYVLKQMKPMRQIECSKLMINVENFSRNFALSLLHNTPSNLLVTGTGHLETDNAGRRKMLDRLEREMAQVHVDTQKLKDTYGVNMLRLVIVKSHITSLLDNPKILQWLLRNKPDLLTELNKISTINSLDE